MPRSNRASKRKKASKLTTKTHHKRMKRTKEDWQKLFRERFFI